MTDLYNDISELITLSAKYIQLSQSNEYYEIFIKQHNIEDVLYSFNEIDRLNQTVKLLKKLKFKRDKE